MNSINGNCERSLNVPSPQANLWRAQQKQQRIFLVITTLCQALLLMPPLRTCSIMLMRSIGIISSVINIKNNERSSLNECSKKVTRVQHVARLALTVVGIVGMGLASTPILLASSISNIALQVFGMIKAVYENEGARVLIHFNVLVISGLGLGAMLTGAWTIVFAIATLNIAVKVISAFRAALSSNEPVRFVNVGCHVAMSAFGIMRAGSAIQSRPI